MKNLVRIHFRRREYGKGVFDYSVARSVIQIKPVFNIVNSQKRNSRTYFQRMTPRKTVPVVAAPILNKESSSILYLLRTRKVDSSADVIRRSSF